MRIFFSSRKSWTLPYLIFSAVFVIIPLILILVYAFTDDAGHLTLENFGSSLPIPRLSTRLSIPSVSPS